MKTVFRKNCTLLLVSIFILVLFPLTIWAQDGTLKWAFKTGGWVGSPAISSDGTIYVGSSDHNLYAINPDGTQQWVFETGGSVGSPGSPAIGPDWTIYVASSYGLYAIYPDGTQKWAFEIGAFLNSSPAIGSDGTIYMASSIGNLYAIYPNGTQKWAFETEDWWGSSPAIGPDGTIYVGVNRCLYAINPDGTQNWYQGRGGRVWDSPAIGADGTIYVGSVDCDFYASNQDGTMKWIFDIHDGTDGSTVIGSDGTIYVTGIDNSKYQLPIPHNLYAIYPDGTQKWAIDLGNYLETPAISSDGTIYVGSNDHRLYAITPYGTKKWAFETGGSLCSPAIGPDGTIYVGSYDHKLYAINGTSGGLANSSWPMFHHDLRHTKNKKANIANDKPTIDLTMGCNTIPANPGKPHQVTIGVDTKGMTIGGLDLILTFIPHQLTPTAVSAIGMASGASVVTNIPTSGQYRIALTDANGFSGTGDILQIDLNAEPSLCYQSTPPFTLQIGIALGAKAYDLPGYEINAEFSAGLCDIDFACSPDGDVAPLGHRDGTVNVGDSLVALRFALGLETPTQEDMAHGDVAPLDANNQPKPDGQITVGDALVILRMALGLVDFNGGGGGGYITTGDFENTTIKEGDFGKSGRYVVETFANAAPAQQQLDQNNIPNVLEQHGNLYVLDIQNWPNDWNIGSAIVVRMEDGRVEYKRLLAKFKLSDGRLAIGIEEASALEVVEQMELNSDGDVARFVRSERSITRNIIDYDFDEPRQVTIINKKNKAVFNESGVYLGFSEISLTMNPTIKISLTIDKPSGISQIVGTVEDLKNSIMDIVQGQVDELDNAIIEAGQVIVGIHLTQAEDIMRLISSNENVIEYLGAIRAVLLDKSRLKEASISLDGDITGTIRIEAKAAGKYPTTDKEVPLLTIPVLVPIAVIPIPIFLEFEPVGEAKIKFDAKVNAEAGMTVTIPVSIRAEVINGELQTLEKNNINPEFAFPDEYISFKEIKGGFTPSIGVQVECGLSLAKILTVSIDPTASIVFDADASLQGNDVKGCADLNWDIYVRLSAEAEAELLSTWDVSWEFPFDFKFFENKKPYGSYQYCWGLNCTDADGDGFYAESGCGTAVDCNDTNISIYPEAEELCDNDKDDNCNGQIDEGCDQPPSLSSITISGSTSVNESSGAQYACKAHYNDGSSLDITSSASWSENSSYSSINSSGYLTTSSVSTDQSCRITVSYGGKSDTHNVTIVNEVSNTDVNSYMGTYTGTITIDGYVHGDGDDSYLGDYDCVVSISNPKALYEPGQYVCDFSAPRLIRGGTATHNSISGLCALYLGFVNHDGSTVEDGKIIIGCCNSSPTIEGNISGNTFNSMYIELYHGVTYVGSGSLTK